MQVVSGLSLVSYWTANLIFDTIKCAIPCILTVCFLFIFDMGYDAAWVTVLLFPIGVVPFSYALSFLFEEESVAQTVVLFGNILAGSFGGMVVFILRIIPATANLGDTLSSLLKAFPVFTISNSIIYDGSKVAFNTTRTFARLQDPSINQISLEPWDVGNVGGDLLALCLHLLIGLTVVAGVELGAFACWDRIQDAKAAAVPPAATLPPDDDVQAEEARVSSLSPEDCLVRVSGLRKVYTPVFQEPVAAIENTSFAVEQGEVFALLGVNGAGKTTTFRSLTRAVRATAGEVTLMGHDVATDFEKARRVIGYCPQYDTIFDLLTVKEHLEYYAVVKGIPPRFRAPLVDKAIQNLNLQAYADKPAGTLSGGNKRKLSVALALLGNPPVVLLDEPSAGMDPEARRFMWSIVAKVSQERKQSGVVITTHSMEEAEALSTKMGIQVQGGVFRCFGSSQHIKHKFATGYEIEVKLDHLTEDEVAAVRGLLAVPENVDVLPLPVLQELMNAQGVDAFLLQGIAAAGSGSEIYQEQRATGVVTVSQLLQWLHTETYGLAVLKFLAREFQEVEILEHVADFYRLRVPRGEKTIGYAFGVVEDAKAAHHISEYSVSQTTLEQIFQSFARVTVKGPQQRVVFSAGAASPEAPAPVTVAAYQGSETPSAQGVVPETAWHANLAAALQPR